MDKSTLTDILLKNVVKLTYIKKNGELRPMFCTKSKLVLNSFEGQTILGFKKPSGGPSYEIALTDNIIVWDLEKRAFRTIQAERVTVDEVVPEDEYYKTLVDRAAGLGKGAGE